jgi:hypothetical protein
MWDELCGLKGCRLEAMRHALVEPIEEEGENGLLVEILEDFVPGFGP